MRVRPPDPDDGEPARGVVVGACVVVGIYILALWVFW